MIGREFWPEGILDLKYDRDWHGAARMVGGGEGVEPDLNYDDLEVGQQFPAIPIVLDADLVAAYV